jgi:hypothetical protein
MADLLFDVAVADRIENDANKVILCGMASDSSRRTF